MRIPPMKFVRAGEMNGDFIALLRVNSRMADVVIGDLKAILGRSRPQVGGCRSWW